MLQERAVKELIEAFHSILRIFDDSLATIFIGIYLDLESADFWILNTRGCSKLIDVLIYEMLNVNR